MAPLRQDKFLSSGRRDDKKQIVVTAPLRQGNKLSPRRRYDKEKNVVTVLLGQEICVLSRRRYDEKQICCHGAVAKKEKNRDTVRPVQA